MALHVLDEANRCLGCKKPMCQQGCPIHTNIPEVIRLLKANELDAAGRMLFENNPLTTVCSLVCNHENQCEGHCIRNRMPSHDPVHFSIIEDYISTTYANKMVAGPSPKNGMKAAVVGAGPAGLTIAVLLARWGYDITIFDARDKIGGVMRYGIPNYRLPDSVLDDFQYHHLDLKGIRFRPNTAIGKTITIDDLFRDGYRSVFIGSGLWKANAMHIKGETLGNVAFGIDYLANSKAKKQEGGVAFLIFDRTSVENAALMKKYESQGYFVKAETLNELAGKLGIDKTNLEATVERWHGFFDKKKDEDFGRTQSMFSRIDKAPYYGQKISPASQTTYGGVERNADGAALKTDGSVIPGLFVAGETADQYGQGVSLGIVTGRIAARGALKAIDAK